MSCDIVHIGADAPDRMYKTTVLVFFSSDLRFWGDLTTATIPLEDQAIRSELSLVVDMIGSKSQRAAIFPKRMTGICHHSLAGIEDLGGDRRGITSPVYLKKGVLSKGGEHHVFRRQVSKGQCLYIRQAPRTLTKTEHLYIAGQLLIHKSFHYVDGLSTVDQLTGRRSGHIFRKGRSL